MDAGIRQQRAAATREQLIAAGLSLAERTGLSGMSVNQIVAEAGVAKGTFFHHFRDRSAGGYQAETRAALAQFLPG